MTQSFRLNTEKFASQSFEDEVIVLDATDGTYYALTGNAPEAWAALIASCPIDVVSSAIAARTGASEDQVAADLKVFASAMVAETVLLSNEADATNDAPTDLSQGRPTYEGFVWDKHSDLDELLLLDPIHEVNPEKGWPHIG
ncbi:MAG: PqqD family protein [Pseudomonadota bacterium]